eukprot:gene44228-54978_t
MNLKLDTPVPQLPAFPIVLVNPLVAVSTPVIFRTLEKKTNPPLAMPAGPLSAAAWLAAMATMRNDLEPPARLLQPVIADVSGALATAGAALVRMSGSGATCFGLFDSDESAQHAAHTLSAAHPECMAGINDNRPFVPVGIAILTVSDTRTLADDKSGDTLEARVRDAGHRLEARTIVPDDRQKIRDQVEAWTLDDTIDV